jgi:hypothetical protein
MRYIQNMRIFLQLITHQLTHMHPAQCVIISTFLVQAAVLEAAANTFNINKFSSSTSKPCIWFHRLNAHERLLDRRELRRQPMNAAGMTAMMMEGEEAQPHGV